MEGSPESYTGIYGMHKYWSKKPFNLVRELILKNSKQGETVLDPFCGSGISIIETILTKRKAIGIDLSPASIFITQQTLMKIDPKKIEDEYKKIKDDVATKINDLYAVKRNKKTFTGTHFVWKNNVLQEIWYKNEHNKKVIDKPSAKDLEFANSFSYADIKFFYPKENLIHNVRINAKSTMHVYDLFTPRNLLALSILYNRIESITDEEIRNIFKFCFTASLGQASRMVFVINARGKSIGEKKSVRKEIGSWVIGYWIPKENFEINAWNCFTNRYGRILKAKREQWNYDYNLNFCKSFSDLKKSNLLLINDSALDALKKLPDHSIDYIVTDPPHGDRLPYLELSLMWNSWLKLKSDFDKELVISDAKERHKNIANYNELFSKIINEMSRILKPNRTLSFMFNSLDDETWKNILTTINNAGLTLQKVGTIGYSATSVVQDNRARGLKTDFVLNFIKLDQRSTKQLKEIAEADELALVRSLIRKLINTGEKHEIYEILNFVMTSLMEKGYLFNISTIIREIDLLMESPSIKNT